MSVFQVDVQVRKRLTCDAAGCSARVTSPRIDNTKAAANVQVAIFYGVVAREGWTFWAGRGLRTYCPDHGPRPGHSMRDVTSEWAAMPAFAAYPIDEEDKR